MSEEPVKTRSQHHEIEIDAPIEAVWKALTDAEELTRWFVEEARVTPGLGGRIWGSWGEGMAGEKQIDDWQPGKRLLLSHLPPEAEDSAGSETPKLHLPVVEEYTLETRGGRTVLRLVQSGVPDTPEWEGYYDGTNLGWKMFFIGMRHYLERHAGKPRKNVMIMRPVVGLSRDEAWRKLIGREGFAALGSLENAKVGGKASVTTSFGQLLNGEVLMFIPPKTIVMTVDSLDGSLLSATLEQMGGMTFFYMTLATFGFDSARYEALREQWTTWSDTLLPGPGQ
jgi:uncharacterized protein YndB with AHSA1/START domain